MCAALKIMVIRNMKGLMCDNCFQEILVRLAVEMMKRDSQTTHLYPQTAQSCGFMYLGHDKELLKSKYKTGQ